MEGHKLTDHLVGLVDLHVENALVIETLSLNHLSVVDTDCQQNGVHDLAENELQDLVLEALRIQSNHGEPGHQVDGVGDDEVPQQHVPHHEYQRQSQLDLQLVEASDSPGAEILDLVGQKDAQNHDSVDQQQICPKMHVLESGVVQFIDQHQLESED